MAELYQRKKMGWVNMYKNDFEMVKKTLILIRKGAIKADNMLENHERTEDGYFLFKFKEIFSKYVQCETSYRHIDPSPLE